jgi:uncharacterized Zn-finger protein
LQKLQILPVCLDLIFQDSQIDPRTFAINRPQPSEDLSDPGTFEEQVEAKKAKEAASTFENEVDPTILPGVAGPSKPVRKKREFKNSKKCAASYKDLYSSSSSEDDTPRGPKRGLTKVLKLSKGVAAAAASENPQKSLLNKPHRCQVCQMSFDFPAQLKRHESDVHERAEPFPCSQCAKSFASQGSLCQHIKSAHEDKANKCQQCPEAFAFPSELKKHVSKVHLGVRHKCPFCDQDFSEKKNVNKHMKKKHEK